MSLQVVLFYMRKNIEETCITNVVVFINSDDLTRKNDNNTTIYG